MEQAAQSILSQRVQAIKESPTLAVTARAAKLKSEGKDIIGLGAGEPDFDTPENIRNAAKAAIDAGNEIPGARLTTTRTIRGL